MVDFTTVRLRVNTGASDASPTWTNVPFGTANNELRTALSTGSQATNTPSATWPSILKPSSATTHIDKWYAFTADTTGFVITGADGTGSHYNVFQIDWDNLGTFGDAPIISAWADNTYPAASAGTQVSPGTGANIVNGTSGESSSRSLIKCAVFGNGRTAAGAADNPSSNMGSNSTATSGGAGATTTSNATWTAWTDLQADTNYIKNGAIPAATTAGQWNFLLDMYIAASMIGGTLTNVVGLRYTWI